MNMQKKRKNFGQKLLVEVKITGKEPKNMAEIVKLNQEYTLDGKKYREIELDFESLTGKKLLIAESEFKKRNKGAAVKELEDGWLLTVAEKASGIKYGSLLELKGKDYIKVINAARNFIVVSDSEETTADTGNEGEMNQEEILETE